jgi:hypothetical protein
MHCPQFDENKVVFYKAYKNISPLRASDVSNSSNQDQSASDVNESASDLEKGSSEVITKVDLNAINNLVDPLRDIGKPETPEDKMARLSTPMKAKRRGTNQASVFDESNAVAQVVREQNSKRISTVAKSVEKLDDILTLDSSDKKLMQSATKEDLIEPKASNSRKSLSRSSKSRSSTKSSK